MHASARRHASISGNSGAHRSLQQRRVDSVLRGNTGLAGPQGLAMSHATFPATRFGISPSRPCTFEVPLRLESSPGSPARGVSSGVRHPARRGECHPSAQDRDLRGHPRSSRAPQALSRSPRGFVRGRPLRFHAELDDLRRHARCRRRQRGGIDGMTGSMDLDCRRVDGRGTGSSAV